MAKAVRGFFIYREENSRGVNIHFNAKKSCARRVRVSRTILSRRPVHQVSGIFHCHRHITTIGSNGECFVRRVWARLDVKGDSQTAACVVW